MLIFSSLFLFLTISINTNAQSVGENYWNNIFKAKNYLAAKNVDSCLHFYLQAFELRVNDEDLYNAFYISLDNSKFDEASRLFQIGCENNSFEGSREFRSLKKTYDIDSLFNYGITKVNYLSKVNKMKNVPVNSKYKKINRQLSMLVLTDQIVRKSGLYSKRMDFRHGRKLVDIINTNGFPYHDSLGYEGLFKLDLLVMHLDRHHLTSLTPILIKAISQGQYFYNSNLAYHIGRVAQSENLIPSIDSTLNLKFTKADTNLLISGRYWYTTFGESHFYMSSYKRTVALPFDPSFSKEQLAYMRSLFCLDSPDHYVERTNSLVLNETDIVKLFSID